MLPVRIAKQLSRTAVGYTECDAFKIDLAVPVGYVLITGDHIRSHIFGAFEAVQEKNAGCHS